jgi:hypothetical protein
MEACGDSVVLAAHNGYSAEGWSICVFKLPMSLAIRRASIVIAAMSLPFEE